MRKIGSDKSAYMLYEKLREGESYPQTNNHNAMCFKNTINNITLLPTYTNNLIYSNTNVQVNSNDITAIALKPYVLSKRASLSSEIEHCDE